MSFAFRPISIADPDPHIFGPPGSGFISQNYKSGSGSDRMFLDLPDLDPLVRGTDPALDSDPDPSLFS